MPRTAVLGHPPPSPGHHLGLSPGWGRGCLSACQTVRTFGLRRPGVTWGLGGQRPGWGAVCLPRSHLAGPRISAGGDCVGARRPAARPTLFRGRWPAPLRGPESPGPQRAGLREKLGDSGRAGCWEPYAATSPGTLWLPVSQFPAPLEPFQGHTGVTWRTGWWEAPVPSPGYCTRSPSSPRGSQGGGPSPPGFG